MHKALSDPLRIRLFELLAARPQSAKELAAAVRMPPDRLYHHLAQLEEAGLIVVAEYRRLDRGKVERVYAPAGSEPPGEAAAPIELAQFLGAMLEATRADITAAAMAREAGERREIELMRSVVCLNDAHVAELGAQLAQLVVAAQENPDPDGAFTTVVWTLVDRQPRQTRAARPAAARESAAPPRPR